MATELVRLSVDIVHMRRLVHDASQRGDVEVELLSQARLDMLRDRVNDLLDEMNAVRSVAGVSASAIA